MEIKALPKTGFKFLEWNGDVNSKSNPILLTDKGPQQVVAKVATKPIEVSLVTKSLNYLDVHQLNLIGGTVEGALVRSKMKLPLTKQKPKAAGDFLGWFNEENQVISSNPEASFSFSSDRTLTAIFREKNFRIVS